MNYTPHIVNGDESCSLEDMKNAEKMSGQWIGTFTGTTDGSLHVNIDEDESNYVGVAYLFQNTAGLPPVVAYFATQDKAEDFSLRHPRTELHGHYGWVIVPRLGRGLPRSRREIFRILGETAFEGLHRYIFRYSYR